MSIWDIVLGKRDTYEETILRQNFDFVQKGDGIKRLVGEKNSSLGWGVAYKGKKYITHSRLTPEKSAIMTLSNWQRYTLLSLFFLVAIGVLFNLKITLIVLVAVISFIYFADFLFSLYLLVRSLNSLSEVKFSKDELGEINEADLPRYTILCPLYKEDKMLAHFMAAIEAIEWPKDKLEVVLLLEKDDHKTIDAARNYDLPFYVKLLIVPDSLPKTKPKACNFGLEHASGKYVVVYDAEDKPDTKQLIKAYLAFQTLPEEVICLQSKLNYYNQNQNFLTKLFTAEYSLWFDMILPGLQSIQTVIPLGGTSNHFKTEILKAVGGWDAFNVTEDCDLGVRLFKLGYKTQIIDSTTLEEANSSLKGWVRQRSRWIKGYIQTYLVHMREPVKFLRTHGVHAFIFQLVIGMRMVFILINPILWITTFSYFAFNSYVGIFIESLYPAPIFYIAVFSLIFGNFLNLYNYMIGLAKRGNWDLIKYMFLIPFYWLFASIAAVVSFYQLVVKPHFWEKTEHGLHLAKEKPMPEIRVTLAFETRIPEVFGNVIRSLSSPLSALLRNLIDFLDLLGPLPEMREQNGLRILIFNWRDLRHVWAGGAEVYIQEVAKRWVVERHNVTLFCGWDGGSQRNETVDGVCVIRRGGFYTVYPLALLYYIFRLKGKYDVIVDCENGIPFFTPFYSSIPKLLLIHHVHQDVFRKHLAFPLSTFAEFLESKVMPFLYKGVPIVTISESSKSDIIQRKWGSEPDVSIVNPGVEVSSLRVDKTSNPSFCYLGRLKPYKNVDIAIRAFAKIKAKYPDAYITIAGFGESMQSLVKLAKKLGVYDSVNFAGRVSEDEKARILSESWVALQPSSVEGWGITVIEANTQGTPVIASDVKGLRDSVKAGITGYLVEPLSADAMAEKMEFLILNARIRSQMSQTALLWSKKFSWEKTARDFLLLITSNAEGLKKYVPAVEVVTQSI